MTPPRPAPAPAPAPAPVPAPGSPCADCPLVDRRGFLEEALLVAVGALAALGAAPEQAAAWPLRFAWGLATGDEERAYPIPATDGATIDTDNQVILVRWELKAYAFNLSCPHQNTALRWQADEHRFQCPKHKSRYQPDGAFISGRATRNMDRFAVRRDGANMVVDLDRLYRQDEDAAAWDAAFLAL